MARPKGSPNKTTKSAKANVEIVFNGLGGHKALLEWCQADSTNLRAFYANIYPRLLPLQHTGDKDDPVRLVVEWAESNA